MMDQNKYKMKLLTSPEELRKIISKAYKVVEGELHTDTNKKFHSLG